MQYGLEVTDKVVVAYQRWKDHRRGCGACEPGEKGCTESTKLMGRLLRLGRGNIHRERAL